MKLPKRLYNGVRVLHRPCPANVRRLDAGCMPMVLAMMKNGIALDTKALEVLDAELAEEQRELEFLIHGYVGKQYNLGSGDQLAQMLFTELGLPTENLKKTKSGARFQTDRKAMAKLKGAHEVIAPYLQWKERSTIRSTFGLSLIKKMDDDGRIRGQILTTRTDTGRLAMKTNPDTGKGANLMNIPTRSELGKKVRKAFVPGPPRKRGKRRRLVSVDLSQIELRLTADNSGDPTMIEAINSGLDIHTKTASEMFHVPFDKVDKETQRKPAKNMNFGIVYGITAQGLLEGFMVSGALGWTLEDCEKFIGLYFKAYPRIKDMMALHRRRARATGCVWDMFGRVRYFPEIHSAYEHVREAADRELGNMPIQGGAQGILKLVMAEVQDFIEATYHEEEVLPLIQVHDELVFECDEDVEDELVAITGAIVENSVPLAVPVGWASKSSGVSWGDMGE